MQLLEFVVAGLATWRITHLLIYENGPFCMLRRMRELLGVRYYEDGAGEAASFKYEITTCMWCLSVWVAGVTVGGLLLVPNIVFWLLVPYALSAIALLVHTCIGHK